jgi:hypothetical protein
VAWFLTAWGAKPGDRDNAAESFSTLPSGSNQGNIAMKKKKANKKKKK